MKAPIYQKFIFIYALIVILSFSFVAIGSSDMILNHLVNETADTLYQEANLLSTGYAQDYYRSQTASSLEEVHEHLSTLGTYLDARIWIILKSKRISILFL